MHKFIKVTLLLSLGFFFLGQNVNAQRMAPDVVCSAGITCNTTGTTCGQNPGLYPELMPAHRLEVTIGRAVREGKLFIKECFRHDTGDFCLPMPVSYTPPANPGDMGVYTMKNNIADNNHEGTIWATSEGREAFMLALEEECIESFVNKQEGIDSCTSGGALDPRTNWDNPDTDSDWYKRKGWLIANDYRSFGVYKNSGTSITQVTTHPTGAAANDKYEIGTRTINGLPRFTLVVAYYTLPEGGVGGDPSDKIGTLGFPSADESCANVGTSSPDPYGRVFNKTSLQPVEGVQMVVYRKVLPPGVTDLTLARYEKVDPTDLRFEIQDPFFTNPYRTDESGGYSFVVPAGEYKLIALDSGSGPLVLADPVQLSTLGNHTLDLEANAFEDKILVSVGGVTQNLYPPDASMGERAKVYGVSVPASTPGTVDLPVITVTTEDQRRDISSNTAPKQMKQIWRNQIADVVTGDLVVTGRINKPFGNIYAETPQGATISYAQADAKGDYTLFIPGSGLVGHGGYNLRFVPQPLTLVPPPQARGIGHFLSTVLSRLIHVVHAADNDQSLVVPVEPRLNYLEGFAYDANGQVLKNAEVVIFSTLTSLPYYTTKTDQDGFFTVYSENLPRNNYQIAYVDPNTKKTLFVSTTEYLAKNEKYIAENKVDLTKPKLNAETKVYLTQHPLPSVTKAQGAGMGPKNGTPGELNQGVAPTKAMDQKNPVNQLSPALLMYVAILLLLIVGAGLLIMYYVKRKQEPHLYE
ncbi:hypothetical protein KBB12_00495 [Candidatus Woesebacteria bacterium]|nr:hypothetical protein [Candidatus Woesebacteria bacterium]